MEPRHWNWNWKRNWNWKWHYKRHYFQFYMAYRPQTEEGCDSGPEDPTHKVTWLFDIAVTWQKKSVISLLSQGLWTPNLAGDLGWGNLTYKVIVTNLPRGHVTNERHYISTFTRPIDLKFSMVVTQDEGAP